MSLVVSEQMTERDARAVTSQIRTSLVAVWDKVADAYHGRAWIPLGYDSWDDYCTSEFDGSRIRIPREQRQDVVTSLRDEGLSLRAIAAATGQGYGTVRRDVETGEPFGSPVQPVTDLITGDDLAALAQPTATMGLDGKTYARPAPAGVIDAEVVEDEPVTPRAASRRAIPDVARDLAMDLKAIADRVDRLMADDRFTRNADEVGALMRHHLAHAIQSCQGLDRSINQK